MTLASVSSGERMAPAWACAVLLLLALGRGVSVTGDLTWPGADIEGVGIDLYRDVALAQTMLDRGYGPDPNYVGERTWYNPLVPSITAAVSAVTGADVPLVIVRVGAYANLLAPLTFALLATALLGPWRGVYALAGYLFLMSSTLPSWISATYSPWLMPVNFAQAPFYLTVLSFVRARQAPSRGRDVVTGALWGVTFLAHAAPALVFGLMVLAAAVADVRSPAGGPASAARVLRGVAVMIAVALLVSSPLLWTILGHYGLRTVHTQPGLYTAPLLGRELPTLLRLHLTAPILVAGVGGVMLWRQPPSPLRSTMFLWFGAAASLLVAAYGALAIRLVTGRVVPIPVPSFHFFFYLKAAGGVLFAIGVVALADAVGRLPALARLTPRVRAHALCLLLLLAGAPSYLARPDFGVARRDAQATMQSDEVRVAEWLRTHRQPADVVLASEFDAAVIAAPSGMRVVAAFNTFSNPYVDWEARARDRDQLFAALDAGDSAGVTRLADRYGVTYAIARGRRADTYGATPGLRLAPVFTAGTIRVFRRQ